MHPTLERTLRYTPWAAVVVMGASAMVGLLVRQANQTASNASIYMDSLGLVLLSAVTFALFGKDTYSHVLDEGDRYEAQRRHGRLRAAAILTRSLGIIGTLAFIVALLVRLDIIDFSPPAATVRRASLLLIVAIAGAAAYAHDQAMHVHRPRDLSDLHRASTALLWLIVTAAAAAASFMALTGRALFAQSNLVHSEDAAILLLGASSMYAALVARSRELPSLTMAILDPGRQTAGGYSPERRTAMAPIVVAFTVLGGFLLLLILLSAGVLRVLQQAGENGLVTIALLLMVGAIIAGVVLSIRTGRQADRTQLYRQSTASEVRDRALLLGISIPLALVLLFSGLLLAQGRPVGSLPEGAWIHLVSAGVMMAVGPYGYYAGRQHHRIRMMEERFPDFLRDLSSSHRGGLTLPAAVQVAARGEYGPLSPEVVKMADQLTWHISFDEALQRMADRVRTPLVRRTISLILEASRSGGNTADVLSAAARDARELKTLERQRRINMSVYTIVIYVVFFVFLFVIGVLYAQFVPAILEAEAATSGNRFGDVGGLNFGGVTHGDYLRFYLTAGMVQAVGNGILAGVMGNGNAPLGLRHAFWMALVTYVTFAFIL